MRCPTASLYTLLCVLCGNIFTTEILPYIWKSGLSNPNSIRGLPQHQPAIIGVLYKVGRLPSGCAERLGVTFIQQSCAAERAVAAAAAAEWWYCHESMMRVYYMLTKRICSMDKGRIYMLGIGSGSRMSYSFGWKSFTVNWQIWLHILAAMRLCSNAIMPCAFRWRNDEGGEIPKYKKKSPYGIMFIFCLNCKKP